jgi:beta-aspartyl-peptidase (threonine type)
VIVVASSNGKVGLQEAMGILKAGGSAVDAVEAGIRKVEDNSEDHTVGYGGYPNLRGEVELDAGIMDGRDLSAGAVGVMQGFRHPISVARRVMDVLPHVLLVGRGAERFAAEMGFQRTELLTEEAGYVWEDRLRAVMPEEAFGQLSTLPDLWRWVKVATDPERAKGTVNLLAQDARGNLCAGTSTSGWAWKHPGRLGDSPIIGAGLYADNRHAAAACTGMGEMAIRAGTAISVVHYFKAGLPLLQAGRQAMLDLRDLGGPYRSGMHIIALDHTGRHAGWSTDENRTYTYLTDEMLEPEEAHRLVVPIEMRWA